MKYYATSYKTRRRTPWSNIPIRTKKTDSSSYCERHHLTHPSYGENPSLSINFQWAPKGTYAVYGTDGVYWLAVKKDVVTKYRLGLEESGSILVYPGLEANAYCAKLPSFEALLAKLNELNMLGKFFHEYTVQLEQQQQIQDLWACV